MNLLRSSGTKFIFLGFLLLLSVNSYAETITCGLKKVTVQGNKITKIIHGDGTVHTGASVSNNWTYDGKAIKHNLIDERINCRTKPKSRDEIISELSGKIAKNPNLYGMNKKEAEQMRVYTTNLMKMDNECYLMVDAAKSTSRNGMFYIDCNNKSSNTKRYWFSENDLKLGIAKKATSPISNNLAIKICSKELRNRTNNPSTYNPSLSLGTTSRKVERTGRNIIEIKFKASNAFGVEAQYTGRCIIEGGELVEVTIKDR